MKIFSYKNLVRNRVNFPIVKVSSVVKVLSNENRYLILKNLLNSKEDLCVGELADFVGISQSAMSHQLAYLEARGVVEGVRDGKTKCYLMKDSPIARKIAGMIKVLE